MLTIGVVGPHYADSLAENIICGLEDLGHRGVPLSGARLLGPSSPRALRALGDFGMRSERVSAAVQLRPLLRSARLRPLDGLIVVDSALTAEAAEALGGFVRPMCFWYPDPVSNLGRQNLFRASYDAVFSKEPRLVRHARDVAGYPAHYLAEACNPRWHCVPSQDEDAEPHIVVMGNYYPYRIRLLERLHAARVPMRLYGNPFPRWMPSPILAPLHTGRYVVRDEKARVLRRATAVLNAVHPAEIDGLNNRLFESAGCGGCVLSEERAELPKHFRVGEEVLSFATFDELVDQARWCIQHPTEARLIGDRAAVRAHAEHTYVHRLGELLRVLGLDSGEPLT